MGDAGYRGVSADQDGRYRNKETLLLKKLAADGQFPAHFDHKVDLTKVNVDVMRTWITERVEALLGFEDDVVVEYVNGMLDSTENRHPDPRKMQLSLTGFMEKSTPQFMSELWTLLLSAQKSIGGIPQEFVDKKKEEMRLARERDAQAIASSGARRGESGSRRDAYPSRWQQEQPRGARGNGERWETSRYEREDRRRWNAATLRDPRDERREWDAESRYDRRRDRPRETSPDERRRERRRDTHDDEDDARSDRRRYEREDVERPRRDHGRYERDLPSRDREERRRRWDQ